MMLWTDINEIAIALSEKYPDFDVLNVNFTTLHKMVAGLDGFQDDPARSNEKILEAIQATWLAEIS